MIREATADDIPRIVEMGAKFHAMSDYGFAGYNPEAVAQFLAATIASPDAVVFTHDEGMIGGALVPLYFDPSTKIAVETFWWADGQGMALLTAFEWWAEAKGAKAVTMSCLEGKRSKALGRVFRSRGYRQAENSYTRVI